MTESPIFLRRSAGEPGLLEHHRTTKSALYLEEAWQSRAPRAFLVYPGKDEIVVERLGRDIQGNVVTMWFTALLQLYNSWRKHRSISWATCGILRL